MADQIKAIIFDVGGVILRTEDLGSRTNLAARHGMTREQLEDFVFNSESAIAATLGNKTARDHWRWVWESLNVPEPERNNSEAAFWQGDQLDRTLIDFLRAQKRERKTALLSNAWSDLRDLLANEYSCLDVFDVPIFSCEVRLAKPDPSIYQLVLEKLDVAPSEAIFVDDNEKNILAAAAMEIHAIHFINTKQTLNQINTLLQEPNGNH